MFFIFLRVALNITIQDVKKAELSEADPKVQGQSVGKAKRVRGVLSWALDYDVQKGETLASFLLSNIKAVGGFRSDSNNFAGEEKIENLRSVLHPLGFILNNDGTVQPKILDNLNRLEQKEVLKTYVNRARRGVEDAALITGTSKDLLEAVSAHVIWEVTGNYPTQTNFPTLLGQAFMQLDINTSYQQTSSASENALINFESQLFELAKSVNRLRNKAGTGHGRPFDENLKDSEATTAVETMGLIAEHMLKKL